MTAVATLTGCVTPSKLDGTPNAVWVQVPAISVGSPDSVAQEHCAGYGKTAVPVSKVVGNTGTWRQTVDRSNYTPIFAYDCK